MFRYRAIIKDLYLSNKRQVKVLADDVQEAHKISLESVNLAKEDISKIYDTDNNLVFTSEKGFINNY